MSKYSPDLDTDHLLKLSRDVERIASALAKLSMSAGALSPSLPEVSAGRPELPPIPEEAVRWLIQARRQRSRFLPADLFAEPAWDILLDLLRAEIAQHNVSVSSLCLAAGVPPTTALRYITNMTEQGVLVRRDDPTDRRRAYIELAPEVSRGLRQYFVEVLQSHRSGQASIKAA